MLIEDRPVAEGDVGENGAANTGCYKLFALSVIKRGKWIAFTISDLRLQERSQRCDRESADTVEIDLGVSV